MGKFLKLEGSYLIFFGTQLHMYLHPFQKIFFGPIWAIFWDNLKSIEFPLPPCLPLLVVVFLVGVLCGVGVEYAGEDEAEPDAEADAREEVEGEDVVGHRRSLTTISSNKSRGWTS